MLDIYTIGADVLRDTTVPVEAFDAELLELVERMFETMILGKGVGLAAPQVGLNKKMFVMQIDGEPRRVFINPQIVETGLELSKFEEGCLSIPGVYADLERPQQVRVQAFNERGRRFTLDADGFLARVIQHELDHLNGILFTDRLPERKRESLLAQYEKRMRA